MSLNVTVTAGFPHLLSFMSLGVGRELLSVLLFVD